MSCWQSGSEVLAYLDSVTGMRGMYVRAEFLISWVFRVISEAVFVAERAAVPLATNRSARYRWQLPAARHM